MPQSVPPAPADNAYWVEAGRFLAGEYPGAPAEEVARTRIRKLLDAGGSFVLSGETDRGYHPGRDLDYGRLEWNGGDVNALALPWGVLAPGTQMRGYLYFRRLDHANAATLTWHFFSDKNQPLVDLAFDFFVARSR